MNLTAFAISFFSWEVIDVLLKYVIAFLMRRLGDTLGKPLYIADARRRAQFASQAPAYAKSTLHALIVALRGCCHLAALWSAPILSKVEITPALASADAAPAAAAWYAASMSVIDTNIILAGYLASDLLHVLLNYPHLGELDTVMHHITFLACACVAGYYHALPFVFGWLIVGEFSTPILNLRWALIKLGNTKGTTFLITESVFGVTFIITRLFIYGAGLAHFAWMLVNTWNLFSVDKYIVLFLTLLVSAGFVLNMVWLAKILHAFKRSRRKANESNERKSN